MKRNLAVHVVFLLIVFLGVVPVPKVSSPPLSSVFVCGLVLPSNADARLSHATINTSIIPDLSNGENLTYHIVISSCYNITNSADHDVYFPVSFVWNDWSPLELSSSLETNVTMEGVPSNYTASVFYNITSREELPVEISTRFPADFFLSYSNPCIDLINITLAAHTKIVLKMESSLSANCLGNYFDFRYGLDMPKLEADSTQLLCSLSLSNTSLLVKTDLLNSHNRSVNQVSDSLEVMWSLSDWDWGGEITYPGQELSNDVFSDYLGIQLWQSEYYPPTLNDGAIEPDILVLVVISVPVIVLAIFVASRRLGT
ncbi:MAG: hypothetical protein ACFFCP_13645 [Promethearchaeota archaeon]